MACRSPLSMALFLSLALLAGMAVVEGRDLLASKYSEVCTVSFNDPITSDNSCIFVFNTKASDCKGSSGKSVYTFQSNPKPSSRVNCQYPVRINCEYLSTPSQVSTCGDDLGDTVEKLSGNSGSQFQKNAGANTKQLVCASGAKLNILGEEITYETSEANEGGEKQNIKCPK